MKHIRDFFITNKLLIFAILLAGMIIDISYYPFIYDFLFFPLLFLWIGLIKFLNLKSSITFKLALFLLLILFGFYIMDSTAGQINRLTTWIYFLLTIGIVQQLRQLRKI